MKIDPQLIPEEPYPEVIDLMQELASLVISKTKGMQEVTLKTIVGGKGCPPAEISVTLRAIR